MKGEQQSKNMNFLRAELRRQGITPTVVKPKPKPLFGSAGKPITPKDIAFFSRQMATMMKSGVPIVQSLEIIGSGHKNVRMKNMVKAMQTDVEGGSSLSRSGEQVSRCSSTSCTATWCAPVKAPVCWKRCWTPSPPTRKTSRR